MHITVTTINAGQDYTAQLNEQATVGDVARYVSRYVSNTAGQPDSGTLEVAREVRFDALLRDVGYQSGDRFVMFTQMPRRAEMPPPLRKGDRVLRFTSGTYEVTSRGKRSLLLGKPDDTQQIIPDVDLRYFVPHGVRHHAHEYISRSALWLSYDEQTRTWYATRMGQTRVTLDEFELGESRVPLNDAQQIRFYRATDEPSRPPTRPLAEMTVRIETISGDDRPPVEAGDFDFVLRMGAEREPQQLNASENLRVGQIISNLAAYNRMTLTDETRVYHLQLLPPDTPLHSLNLERDSFLYSALGGFYVNNELHLRDIHADGLVYRVTAGFKDEESLIGCSLNPNTPDPNLDVDLYESTRHAAMSPATRPMLARQAHIAYRARENTWWIRADEQARVSMFVNNQSVTTHTPVQLHSGDVLSFGQSIHHYYIRLEVELR